MTEWIDVLTESGAPANRRKSKADIHRDGDWHRAAHVWIVTPEHRVLLQKRSLAKENWPGLWDVSVAGHVSAGESAVDAAIREAREEIGIEITASELRHIGTVIERCVLNNGSYLDNEIHEIFVCEREVDLKALTLDPKEVETVALVAPDELERRELVPHPEEYAIFRANLRGTQR